MASGITEIGIPFEYNYKSVSVATCVFWFDSGGLSAQKSVTLGQFGAGSLVNLLIQASGNGGFWGTLVSSFKAYK